MTTPSITAEFRAWPKIARWSREVIITEKIDGTNAQVFIGDTQAPENAGIPWLKVDVANLTGIAAGSRTRWITLESDNHGFARWVDSNAFDLFKLGPGRHYGEWWGEGIQRNYGLTEKRFSLFNVSRWIDSHLPGGSLIQCSDPTKASIAPACCHVVPVLCISPEPNHMVQQTLDYMKMYGSKAAPGFMRPEGIVIFHTHSGAMFKKTLEKDEVGKDQRQ